MHQRGTFCFHEGSSVPVAKGWLGCIVEALWTFRAWTTDKAQCRPRVVQQYLRSGLELARPRRGRSDGAGFAQAIAAGAHPLLNWRICEHLADALLEPSYLPAPVARGARAARPGELRRRPAGPGGWAPARGGWFPARRPKCSPLPLPAATPTPSRRPKPRDPTTSAARPSARRYGNRGCPAPGRLSAARCSRAIVAPCRRRYSISGRPTPRALTTTPGTDCAATSLPTQAGRYTLETVVPGRTPAAPATSTSRCRRPMARCRRRSFTSPARSRNATDGIFHAALLMAIETAGDAQVGAFDFVLNVS